MTLFVDDCQRPVSLGRELGRGGEGAVYDIAGSSGLVAKIYAAAPDGEHVAKLHALISQNSPAVEAVCAWPRWLLWRRGLASPAGFAMRKVEQTEPLDSLISPSQRRQTFPGADWRFVVRAARNLAEAVNELHNNRVIIGDLNETNVRVGRDAMVRFIDCDSFQVADGTRVFRSPVASLLYCAPELQGIDVSRVNRTADHDAFSLAVLIFRLLFLGRHPFAGRQTSGGDQPDIQQLIAQYKFAFGAAASRHNVTPPPDALRLTQIPNSVSQLFERAFAPRGSSNPSRPTAAEWGAALAGLEHALVRCQVVSLHWYPRAAVSCPWCAIESSAGVSLFSPDTSAAAGDRRAGLGDFDVQRIWGAISAVMEPRTGQDCFPDPPELAEYQDGVIKAGSVAISRVSGVVIIGGIIALMVAVGEQRQQDGAYAMATIAGGFVLRLMSKLLPAMVPVFGGPRGKAARDLRRALNTARSEVSASRVEFLRAKQRLAGQRDDYLRLRGEYEKRLESLRAESKAVQLRAHLARFSVRAANVQGLGQSLVRALESYGIDSADDIDYNRVQVVRGIGPKRARSLVLWQQVCASSFRFDAQRAIEPLTLSRLVRDFSPQHEALVKALSAGPQQLQIATTGVDRLIADRSIPLKGLAARLGTLMRVH